MTWRVLQVRKKGLQVEDAGTGVQTEGRDESEVTEAVRGQLGYRGPQPNLSRLSTLFPWTPDDVGPGAVRSRGHVNAIHKPYPSSSWRTCSFSTYMFFRWWAGKPVGSRRSIRILGGRFWSPPIELS